MTIDVIIKEFMNNKGVSQTHLAEKMNESRQNLRKKISKKSIDTEYLYKIGVVLEHNFFADIATVFETETGIKNKHATPAVSALEAAIIELIKQHT